MARAIILGAGFGGIATATRLRRLLEARHEVVLIDRRADFVMGLRKTWGILGIQPMKDGTRVLADLRAQRIDVRQGTVEAVDPAACRVTVDGRHLEGDAIVVALGADQVPSAVPGLADFGINAWDRTQATRAHDALARLDAGRLVVGVFGTPYSCPPGPFELALLAQESLTRRGARVTVEVFGPMPIALPVVGAAESAKMEALLERAEIAFHRSHAAASVAAGSVHFADGSDLGFDVLLAIPPHRCPRLLVEAGLASHGGWVNVDPSTLATSFTGVYAIGDCTAIALANGLSLPKAGVFAEAQGYIVAERIAAGFEGRTTDVAFDGEGTCYAEIGGGEAVKVRGRFRADPPAIEISSPASEHVAAKRAFEADRLAAWFGPQGGAQHDAM